MHFGNQRKKFIHLSTLSWHHNESPSRGHVPRVPACPRVSPRVSSDLAFNGTSPFSSSHVPISGYQEPGVRSVCVTDYVHWRLRGENINRHPSLSTNTWISSKNFKKKPKWFSIAGSKVPGSPVILPPLRAGPRARRRTAWSLLLQHSHQPFVHGWNFSHSLPL